jgi:hypothetical protein
VKGNRFYVRYNNKIINFGSAAGEAYVDHRDKQKRKAWYMYARHSKIQNKHGQYVIDNPDSSSYWSANILWSGCSPQAVIAVLEI